MPHNMTPLDARKRVDLQWSIRKRIETTWQEIERLVVPYRGEFFKQETSELEVQWERPEVFDTTAIEAARTLSASLQGSLTSSLVRWFEMHFRDEALNKDAEAKQWLQQVSTRVFSALQESNFFLEIPEAYLDMVSYGTTCLVEEAVSKDDTVWRGVSFMATPIRECFFEEDFKDQPVVFYRKVAWTPVQIISKFGDQVPEYLKIEAESAQSVDKRYEVVYCIYQNEDDWDGIPSSVPLAPDARPFQYFWFMHNDLYELGDRGGYYEMPAFLGRWMKTSGSMWGHSPATIAIADIKTLQKLVELILRSAEKVVDPATLTTQRGIIGDLDLEAGGITLVRKMEDVQAHESKARFDVSELERDLLQAQIKRIFHVDQLELKDSPAMTATEANIRYELMNRLIGPALGRIQHDILDPTIMRTYGILFRAGELPEIPQSVLETGAEIDIAYTGPMSRAQKLDQMVTIDRWIEKIGMLAQLDPSVLDVPDFDEVIREAALILNVPATMVKPVETVLNMRKERAEQQAEADKLAKAAQGGEAAQSMGEGVVKLREAGIDPEEMTGAA